MLIGVPKEKKNNECRVSLIPGDIATLVKAGHRVCVEKDAGLASSFPNAEYERAGARICDTAYDCSLIVGVKPPPPDVLRDNQIVMAYLHVQKDQSAKLLAALRKKKILSYAYEEIRNDKGERLVNLGFEAGIVGIAEGLRIRGEILEASGVENPFKTLLPVRQYGCKEESFSAAGRLHSVGAVNVIILGKGRVSLGVQEVLKRVHIEPTILGRDETRDIRNYLPAVDILVNAVDWYPGEPHIVRRSDLRLLKTTALILDISCDRNGAVETCIPTTWDDPVYKVEGITHFCVDNLPSAIPRDSSVQLSGIILPHVLNAANGRELHTGIMTKGGQYVCEKTRA